MEKETVSRLMIDSYSLLKPDDFEGINSHQILRR